MGVDPTLELLPVRGTTAPLIPRAVPLPPASPVTRSILPWAYARGMAARANMKVLESILKPCVVYLREVVSSVLASERDRRIASMYRDVKDSGEK